jgi:hypothetical protein
MGKHNVCALQWLTICLALAAENAPVRASVNSFPREIIPGKRLVRFDLKRFAIASPTWNDCRLSFGSDGLQVKSTGADPFFELPVISGELPNQLLIRVRATFHTGGAGRIYWRTRNSPKWSEQQAKGFRLIHDGHVHEYQVPLELDSGLVQLRLDPGAAAGTAVIASIDMCELRVHPLEIEAIMADAKQIRLDVRNHSRDPLQVKFGGRMWELSAKAVGQLEADGSGAAAFETRLVEIEAAGLPPLRRRVVIIRPDADAHWESLRSGSLEIAFATDGSGARIKSDGQVVAYVAPLVHFDGETSPLKLQGKDERHATFRGEAVTLRAELRGTELKLEIDSDRECEGPVVRPVGELEQGLLAGLEYLGKGEQSSSILDIETDEHLRFAPDRFQVTMPLAVCRTAAATVSLTWDDMHLQPRYAVPNFVDGAPGHRMSLFGHKIHATLRIVKESLEDAIVWAVTRRGLPQVPNEVRSRVKEDELCLAALDGPLRGPNGWGHCAEPNWERAPYADMASTVFRLTGRIPDLLDLKPDGSHLRNDTAYFLTGRARQWREMRAAEAYSIREQEQPDASFHYSGPYGRGHFEDTASGYEAERAVKLLDWAAYSGDVAVRESGIKSLERMRRFRTPRGAQTWEIPLHTPDILASAWLVRAYLRGYELTGRREYLRDAVKWAITGVPFVYQWSERPVMLYATIGVLGATNWQSPNWIGLPVQWCGIVYADAISRLAEYDRTLNWRRLAEGILRAAQQMQWPDGQFIGCLPDSFELLGQQRLEAAINPCALVFLQRRLAGLHNDLYLATTENHRLVAPFPVSIQERRATLNGAVGITYDVLIDGERSLTIKSKGVDVVDLEATTQ